MLEVVEVLEVRPKINMKKNIFFAHDCVFSILFPVCQIPLTELIKQQKFPTEQTKLWGLSPLPFHLQLGVFVRL